MKNQLFLFIQLSLLTLTPLSLFAQVPCQILDNLEFLEIDCDRDALYCMDIPANEIQNYQLTINGNIYQDIRPCAFDTSYQVFIQDLNQPGDYEVLNWTVNNISFSGSFLTTEDLVDSINTWDPSGQWEYNESTLLLTGGVPSSDYSDIDISINSNPFFTTLVLNTISTPNGFYFGVYAYFEEFDIKLENTINGCIDTTTLEVDLPRLRPQLTAGDESCDENDGTLTLEVTGAIGDLTYEYSNGIGISQDTFFENLPGGLYFVSVRDSERCFDVVHHNDTVFIQGPSIYEVRSNPASCNLQNGNAIVSNAFGSNYAFNWSNGSTSRNQNNLAPGWYSVTVTYDGTCESHENIEVEELDNCKTTISGYVQIDSLLPDCINDSAYDWQSVQVQLSQSGQPDKINYTNSNGQFAFLVEPGEYTLSLPAYEADANLICPASNMLPVNALEEGVLYPDNNFYLQSEQTNLSIDGLASFARSNAIQTITIYYTNNTPVAANMLAIDLAVDPLLEFEETTNNGIYNMTDSKVSWVIDHLPAFSQGSVRARFLVPQSIPLGTLLDYESNISINDPETTLEDNTSNWTEEVRNSIDPNDKTGFPKGVSPEGRIDKDLRSLSYRINFQNTGNDTAYVVVLHDTLDASVFNIASIRPLEASHEYEIDLKGENILVFNFQNINLPDSTTNFLESNGYVIFSIKLKENLPLGTTIENSAAIFFDYNPPIITNTTLHTISDLTEISTLPSLSISDIEITPNPTVDFFSINYQLNKSSKVKVDLLDAQGKMIQNIQTEQFFPSGAQQIQIDHVNIPNGLYWLRFDVAGNTIGRKLIIQR